MAAETKGDETVESSADRLQNDAPPAAEKRTGTGPNPFAVIAGAVVAGFAVAKVVDWRGHAHPRD
jgi:hypothetical protein